MNWKRTAAIVVIGGAVAAWLSAAITPGGRGEKSLPVVRSTPIEVRGAELASEIARLHERLRPDTAPQQLGRNLFLFRAPVAGARAPVVPSPAVRESVPTPAPAPPLKLAGIAEDAGPDGPVRTAIISGDGQLFLVKEGDAVTLRYRVAHISADVVELTDLGDGSARRLALK